LAYYYYILALNFTQSFWEEITVLSGGQINSQGITSCATFSTFDGARYWRAQCKNKFMGNTYT